MRHLIIVSGISGSGKSTLVEQKINKIIKSCGCQIDKVVAVCSTDNYWLRPDGIYDWNPKYIGEAHKWNQHQALNCMFLSKPYIFIDNTNLTFQEIKPYLVMAKKQEYDVEIIEPQTEWRLDAKELAKRNAHQVPLATIEKMLARKEPLEQLQRKAKEFMDA